MGVGGAVETVAVVGCSLSTTLRRAEARARRARDEVGRKINVLVRRPEAGAAADADRAPNVVRSVSGTWKCSTRPALWFVTTPGTIS